MVYSKIRTRTYRYDMHTFVPLIYAHIPHPHCYTPQLYPNMTLCQHANRHAMSKRILASYEATPQDRFLCLGSAAARSLSAPEVAVPEWAVSLVYIAYACEPVASRFAGGAGPWFAGAIAGPSVGLYECTRMSCAVRAFSPGPSCALSRAEVSDDGFRQWRCQTAGF